MKHRNTQGISEKYQHGNFYFSAINLFFLSPFPVTFFPVDHYN